MSEDHTPPPDIPEENPGIPFRAPYTTEQARDRLTMAIRDATHTRDSTFEGIREQMVQADEDWNTEVGAAWRTYDLDIARIHPSIPVSGAGDGVPAK